MNRKPTQMQVKVDRPGKIAQEEDNLIESDNFNELDKAINVEDYNSVDREDPGDLEGIFEKENPNKSKSKKLSKEELLIKKIKSQQRKIVVRAIEFDWVFDEELGSSFFQTLI
jgi:hypothetical protein